MHEYKVIPVGGDAAITVRLATPASWAADVSDPDGPSFTIPGAEIRILGITALRLTGDLESRVAKAIRLQFGEADGVERSELPGGRVWTVRHDKAVDHARLFVPYDGGVVMAVAILTHASADRMPAIKQVFETLTVAARSPS